MSATSWIGCWNQFSNLGVRAEWPVYRQKSAILTNRLCLMMGIVPILPATVLQLLFEMWIIGLLFVSFSVLSLACLLLNRKSLHQWTGIILSILLPLIFTIGSAFAKSIGITDNAIFYLVPRYVIVIFGLFPLIAFGYNQLTLCFVGSLGFLLSFLFFDAIHGFFGIYLHKLPFDTKFYAGTLISSFGLYFITGIAIFFVQQVNATYEKKIHHQNSELALAREQSERLLRNILPEEVAQELKEKGYATPQHYEEVSVLFADVKGFTKIAEALSPKELIEELNACFMAFDEICAQYGLERIKTIGDAYMAACGVPAQHADSAYQTVLAALDMQAYMAKFNQIREDKGQPVWQIRMGIHTGPVIAGVVGKQKFAYDIWGDAVNVAARMEQHGEIDKVNLSGNTFELLKGRISCAYRGKVYAKNKGEVDMYWAEAGS